MHQFQNQKELFEFIRSADTSGVPALSSIFEKYNLQKTCAEDVLKSLSRDRAKILLIDARSEREFEESALPLAVNFPVLNNAERHNVGLIYKKYSQSAALWLAMSYADPKSEQLRNFLDENDASGKSVYVYCWRGGGRSGYLTKMICDLGIDAKIITGGQKSFRRIVNNFFSVKDFPFELIELFGLTGCGKSELIRAVADETPVIDLESAARHYSSLLGLIPYEIKKIAPVKNQSAFENNLFAQIAMQESGEGKVFLIESESRKVGDFQIPESLYVKMKVAPCIKITGKIENRVRRIVRDYFGEDLSGIEFVRKKLKEKEKFFRQQTGGKTFDELMALLDQKRVDEFTELMLKEYYDKKYKDRGKIPIAEISIDNFEEAVKELKSLYSKITND